MKGKREGESENERLKRKWKKTHTKNKIKEVDRFGAPKRSIILLNSKNFLCKGGPAPPPYSNLHAGFRGKNMILKGGGTKITKIHP